MAAINGDSSNGSSTRPVTASSISASSAGTSFQSAASTQPPTLETVLPLFENAASAPTSPGIIAGGVIGGIVCLFLLVTVFLFLRRRWRDTHGGAYVQTRSGPSNDRSHLNGVNMVGLSSRTSRGPPSYRSSMTQGLLDQEKGIQRPKYWLSDTKSEDTGYAGEEFDPDTLIMDAAHHDPQLYSHDSESTSTISFNTAAGDLATTQASFPPEAAVDNSGDVYLASELTSAFKRPVLGSVSSSLTTTSAYSGTSNDDWSSDGSKSWIPVTTPSPGSELREFRFTESHITGVSLRDVRASDSRQRVEIQQQESLLGESNSGYADTSSDKDGLR